MVRNKNNIRNKFICLNSGFTMVELIVVLALMSILLSITIAGGLAWQDWSRFQHEDTVAEEIFITAQNQLTEYDASEAMERKVMNKLKVQDPVSKKMVYYSGSDAEDGFVLSKSDMNSIAYNSDGDTYDWSKIWKSHTDDNADKDQDVFMLRLRAVKGDYDKYLLLRGDERTTADSEAENIILSADTILLFDLVSPYLSDPTVLNGAIVLEFSPEAGQVFSVCYSDQQDELVYEEDVPGSIMDRSVQAREKRMIGYCCADQLYEKLRGRSTAETNLILEVSNGNMLTMVLHNVGSLSKGDELRFSIYDGRDETTAMSFAIQNYKPVDIPKDMDSAMRNPTPFEVTFEKGLYSGSSAVYNIPAWIKGQKLYFVLDAADIQAQSVSFYESQIKIGADDEEKEAFKRTYSFYRFGLTDVYYIYASASVKHGGAWVEVNSVRNNGSSTLPDYQEHVALSDEDKGPNGEIGECTTFASADIPINGSGRTLKMTNARHLYNVRYETDYKARASVSNTFVLADNIDWEDFSKVYFVNSYINNETPAGINYKGDLVATHLEADGQSGIDPFSTEDSPFPGFRCLDVKDTFTQAADTDYSISGLNITISANLVYGVYDTAIEDRVAELKSADMVSDARKLTNALASCKEGDFSGLMGESGITPDYDQDDGYSLKYNPARGGLLPLGLFAENLGTIDNITLKNHHVMGMQVGVQKSAQGATRIIYSCMVGGFAGNNIGVVSNLVLDEDSSVNGRTDVGGIIGRQSFVLASKASDKRDVTLSNLKNYGTISGMENVGGIIGRAYSHYVDDVNRERTVDYSKHTLIRTMSDNSTITVTRDKDRSRYEYYHDGYYISDTNRSLSGVQVQRAHIIHIENCSNRGKVSGDPIIYSNDNTMDADSTSNLHCAFIGGIAGITQDGYILDAQDETINNYTVGDYYLAKQSPGFLDTGTAYVQVKNCDSFYTYTKAEVTAMFKMDQTGENYTNLPDSVTKDLYVGGLIGYARLTLIENCNNNVDEDGVTTYLASSANDDVPVVLGRRYVGGVVGCSDFVRYDKGSAERAATNYNLVIGERYVGGVAGANGIGVVDQSELDFSNPSKNDGSEMSQLFSEDMDIFRKVAMKDVRNVGIVLGLKADRAAAIPIDSDGISGTGANDADSGAIGGVIGGSRSSSIRISSIQSHETKQYALELIGFTSDDINKLNDLSVRQVEAIRTKSSFGGNEVGGLIGLATSRGYINNLKSLNKIDDVALVDAIVYGQNYVGGAAGRFSRYDDYHGYFKNIFITDDSSDTTQLRGLHVFGNDVVGGLYGYHEQQSELEGQCLTDMKPIECAFYVWGRYAVGAAAGEYGYSENAPSAQSGDVRKVWFRHLVITPETPVVVKGISYVGGFAGVLNDVEDGGTRFIDVSKSISNIEVYGDTFVGAYFGAEVVNNQSAKDPVQFTSVKTLKNGTFTAKNIKVNGKVYVGGLCGLFYAIPKDRFETFSHSEGTDLTGKLYVLAKSMQNSLSATEDSVIINDAYAKVSNADILFREKGEGKVLFDEDTSRSYVLDAAGISTDTIYVNGSIFAGGLIGYVPEGLKLTIQNFENNASVYTSGSITNVGESYDKTAKYSYLGGVIGRVPKNTVLLNCTNTKRGSYSDDATAYYDAAAADYIGGLAEVNAGVVSGTSSDALCTNSTALTKEGVGVGAFVGVNGTAYTDGATTGRILYCKNMEKISGKNVGGIASTSGGASSILGCENHGELAAEASGSAGGILCDVMSAVDNSKLTTIADCVNTGVITVDGAHAASTAAGIVYNTGWKGVLNNCRNYGTGLVNGITSADSDKSAKSIHYCFDSTDATNHIGAVKTPGTDMYLNFYIGEEPVSLDTVPADQITPQQSGENYFVAKQFYITNHNTQPIWHGLPMTYTKLDPVEDISNLVMGADIDADDKYVHNAKSRWKIKNDSYNELGFEIYPVHADGTAASANMNSFSIVWDNIFRTEWNYFYRFKDLQTTTYADVYDEFYNKQFSYNSQTVTLAALAQDEFNQANRFAAANGRWASYLSERMYAKENYNFMDYALCAYGYLVTDDHEVDVTQMSDEDLIEEYFKVVYGYADTYSMQQWDQNINLTITYVYDIIITDVNGKVCEATQVYASVPTESSSPKYDITDITTDMWNNSAGKHMDDDFDPTKVRKISIIIWNERDHNRQEVGIRAFQWISSNQQSSATPVNMVPPDATPAGDEYSGCSTINDILSMAVTNDIEETPFVVDRDAPSPFKLRLVYNQDAFDTGINRITYHPQGDTYLKDYNAYNLSKRKVMQLGDKVDSNYQLFLNNINSVQGAVDVIKMAN